MPREYPELEISLHRRYGDTYTIEMRLVPLDSDSDIALLSGGTSTITIKPEDFRQEVIDAKVYGLLLGACLLNNPTVRSAFEQTLTLLPLRIRLLIGPTAPELHALRWETLRDPLNERLLFAGEQILFSRYLSSQDWQRVGVRSKTELKALLVVANPTKAGLSPIDVQGEQERAEASLKTALRCSLLSNGAATLPKMIAELRQGYDILYLVCHGAIVGDRSRIWLENEQGEAAPIEGEELAQRIWELPHRPRLVVLVSCESAGKGDEGYDRGQLSIALGPMLAGVGVPAVLAMQGQISMPTAGQFLVDFFEELMRDGQLDRAASVARGKVREQQGFWMPILFMRLRSGRIWYVPGFSEEREGFRYWPAVLEHIANTPCTCTPILGPGLMTPLLGHQREIVRDWVKKNNYPISPCHWEDLEQITQYLAVDQRDDNFPRKRLLAYLCEVIRSRFENQLGEPDNATKLEELLSIAGKLLRQQPDESYRILADLPFTIYITTNTNNLLTEALRDVGREPVVEICPWNENVSKGELRSADTKARNYRPSEKAPLVYHMFGHLSDPASLVLKEDDYFNYLIGVTKNRGLIPSAVLRAFTDSSLLFLGFQFEDWNFRVLFRSIMNRAGDRPEQRYAHAAVQIDPEEGRITDQKKAREFLVASLDLDKINLYEGSDTDFLRELHKRWKARS